MRGRRHLDNGGGHPRSVRARARLGEPQAAFAHSETREYDLAAALGPATVELTIEVKEQR